MEKGRPRNKKTEAFPFMQPRAYAVQMPLIKCIINLKIPQICLQIVVSNIQEQSKIVWLVK